MAEYAASPSCVKLHMQRHYVKNGGFISQNSYFRNTIRKHSHVSFRVYLPSMSKMCKISYHGVRNLKPSNRPRGSSLRSSCLAALVNHDGVIASDWISDGNHVLLMTSIFLTYLAGVIPTQKSFFTSPKHIYNDNVVRESSSSSGSTRENVVQVDSKYAWDVVKDKLLDSLDAVEQGSNMGNRVLEYQRQLAKRPLTLYAVSEGPKLRLLWASFQRLEEEVNSISISSDTWNRDDILTVLSGIIRKCCQPVCMGWLEKELSQENSNYDEVLVSLVVDKLNADDTVLQNIRKLGKEDLFAELLFFLRFGSLRKGSCYDTSLFVSHGGSILEDLVITLADGIASIYLELISVDGNLSNEMINLGLGLCNLSTRALQKLRNEVVLNQWLYQNLEAVVSMYEDRFDICTFQSQLIEDPSRNQAQNYSWWKKITRGNSGSMASPLQFLVISHFSMPVKRTKELRALTGWRYYFSLFLELSDISMPLIRSVFDKVSGAISFFLVSLIGRSLGLIYTGIRQSLRWK